LEIKEFQSLIRDIYVSRDRARGEDPTFLWFLEEVGELTRAYRRRQMEKIGSEMADVVAWLASVANLLNIDLEAELLKKYPRMCSLCRSLPCRCPAR
jgi:NTP pyrophosphatase (non-canonical NTP hydrolase)